MQIPAPLPLFLHLPCLLLLKGLILQLQIFFSIFQQLHLCHYYLLLHTALTNHQPVHDCIHLKIYVFCFLAFFQTDLYFFPLRTVHHMTVLLSSAGIYPYNSYLYSFLYLFYFLLIFYLIFLICSTLFFRTSTVLSISSEVFPE